jgi:4-amino-4-deoxy-L-arabinose transferase-like glycosyltransferase
MSALAERSVNLPPLRRLYSSVPVGVFAGALVLVAAFAARLPLRADVLINWDSVQFAYAIETFDLHQHRPHPPGYIGYIYLAKALNHLTGDANASFVLISLFASAIAPLLFLVLARKLMSQGSAYVTTALFATSPLLWYYGSVALTYAAEAALATGFGLAAWQARRFGGWWLVLASALLASLGAIRQTGEVLLLPLWVWAVWPATLNLRLGAAAVLTAGSLLWMAPLLWLAGGPLTYLSESRSLAQSSAGSTLVFSGSVHDISLNWVFVIVSVTAAAGAALIPLAAFSSDLRETFRSLREEKAFLLLWAVPASLVFLFIHMGQAGYVLLMAPPFLLFVGRLWDRAELSVSLRNVSLAGLVLVNALIVFYVPGAVYRSLSPDTRLADQLRQFVPAENDAYWREMIDFVEGFEPENTAILTSPGGPNSSSGFRPLSYYLPDYHVYAAGWGIRGGFGLLYSSFEHVDDYAISRNLGPGPVLRLQGDVKHLLITDWTLLDEFDFMLHLTHFKLSTGQSIWLADVPPGTTLVFRDAASYGLVRSKPRKPVVDALPPRSANERPSGKLPEDARTN